MQTFLPFDNFDRSVSILDTQRLIKQYVEASQIADNVILRNFNRWNSHPCVKMWINYPKSLFNYIISVRTEIVKRNYSTSKIDAKLSDYFYKVAELEDVLPEWLGMLDFHKSHQQSLLFKTLLRAAEFLTSYELQVSPSKLTLIHLPKLIEHGAKLHPIVYLNDIDLPLTNYTNVPNGQMVNAASSNYWNYLNAFDSSLVPVINYIWPETK